MLSKYIRKVASRAETTGLHMFVHVRYWFSQLARFMKAGTSERAHGWPARGKLSKFHDYAISSNNYSVLGSRIPGPFREQEKCIPKISYLDIPLCSCQVMADSFRFNVRSTNSWGSVWGSERSLGH